MDLSKIKISGNADSIINKVVSWTRIPMLRYEDVFTFYALEPLTITIKENEMSEGSVNERILRIIRWNNVGASYSWSIYAEDRHEFNKVVVKKVIWNMETDKKRMIEFIDIDPEKVLMACPDINIVSVYIDEKHSQQIVEAVKELDELAEKGIVWDTEEHPTWEWKDLDILRLYDWGRVNLLWCPCKKCEELEKRMKRIIELIDYFAGKKFSNVYSMKFNYSESPEKRFEGDVRKC